MFEGNLTGYYTAVIPDVRPVHPIGPATRIPDVGVVHEIRDSRGVGARQGERLVIASSVKASLGQD